MEKDDELKGSGNSYDYGFRIYDPRIARWLSIDPLTNKYPSLSPYVFVNNQPIMYKDGDGRVIVDANGNVAVEIDKYGKPTYTQYATEDIKTFVQAVSKTEIGVAVIQNMVNACNNIEIEIDTKSEGYWDRKQKKYVDVPSASTEEHFGVTIPTKIRDDGELPDVKIKIFTKTIDRVRDVKPGEANFQTILNKRVFLSDFTLEEVIGGTGAHEGTHASDPSSNSFVIPKPTNNVEQKPRENQLKFYQELDKEGRKIDNVPSTGSGGGSGATGGNGGDKKEEVPK